MPNHKPTTKSAASSTTTSKKAVAPAPAASAPAPAAAPVATPPPAASTAPAPAAAPNPTPPAAPDPNAALAAFAQQAVATIVTIAAGLGNVPALTAKDKQHAAKFRKGGEPIVTTIGNLALHENLQAPALPVATMMALLGRANAVAPLVDKLANLVAMVNDLMFEAQSQAWGMAMTYYALLQRGARTDGHLAASLVPVTQFLNYRHPSTKPAVGQPTKRQVNAAKKAQKALAEIAGGKLANTDLLKSGQGAEAAPAPAAASAPASAPAPATNGASPVTNGAAPPAAH